MPNQSLLYTGRVLACTQLPAMMHIARELCGGQICITPDAASFAHPVAGKWLNKFYSVNEDWVAEDRRKLLAFARDLLNSDYAGHRLTFQLFAQAPAIRAPGRRLQQFRLERAARIRPASPPGFRNRCSEGQDNARRMTHRRIRKFNTRDTYPEQKLDNDLCQVVVAGNMVFVRGQVGQDLDTSRSVGPRRCERSNRAGDVEYQSVARRGRKPSR